MEKYYYVNIFDFFYAVTKINVSQYPSGATSWIFQSGCTGNMIFEMFLLVTYNPVDAGNE